MKIVNRKKFIRSVAIVVFLLIALFSKSVAKSDTKEKELISYTVSQNETLWSIAKEHKEPKEDIRQYVYELQKINNLENAFIYPGQTIQIKKGQ